MNDKMNGNTGITVATLDVYEPSDKTISKIEFKKNGNEIFPVLQDKPTHVEEELTGGRRAVANFDLTAIGEYQLAGILTRMRFLIRCSYPHYKQTLFRITPEKYKVTYIIAIEEPDGEAHNEK